MNHLALEQLLNHFLQTTKYKDYAPNGLQVEGKSNVKKIVTGVTACQLLLNEAVKLKADAVLVHHGYFWKNEPMTITGIKQKRIKTLLINDINLFGYHLPLDGHEQIGNNALIGKMLDITIDERKNITDLLFKGNANKTYTAKSLKDKLASIFNHSILSVHDNAPLEIKRLAWCSGGGQDFIEQAILERCDAFITGEVSERTIHIARENGIHFYAAGHHATERCGIKALGEWLRDNHQFDVTFVDIDNPA